MKSMKLLSLMILLGLLFTHSGAVAAAGVDSVNMHPMPRLDLTYEFSPLTVYPPIVIFTAKLNFIPLIIATSRPVVEFYGNSASLCEVAETSEGDCNPGRVYLGSALLDRDGKAVFAKPFYPGRYNVVAKIRINALTVWSNEVSFVIGQ